MLNFNVVLTCSRNARMTGVMMVSSGMLCSVIHVVSTAFFELMPGALFRARAVGRGPIQWKRFNFIFCLILIFILLMSNTPSTNYCRISSHDTSPKPTLKPQFFN